MPPILEPPTTNVDGMRNLALGHSTNSCSVAKDPDRARQPSKTLKNKRKYDHRKGRNKMKGRCIEDSDTKGTTSAQKSNPFRGHVRSKSLNLIHNQSSNTSLLPYSTEGKGIMRKGLEGQEEYNGKILVHTLAIANDLQESEATPISPGTQPLTPQDITAQPNEFTIEKLLRHRMNEFAASHRGEDELASHTADLVTAQRYFNAESDRLHKRHMLCGDVALALVELNSRLYEYKMLKFEFNVDKDHSTSCVDNNDQIPAVLRKHSQSAEAVNKRLETLRQEIGFAAKEVNIRRAKWAVSVAI